MLKSLCLTGVALLGGLLLSPAVWAAELPASPRIGLVLGGGGARGAAHIGVLEVLEELRIPVSCIAGTSMGALVAGAYASGVSPSRMRQEMAAADWKDMFIDTPGFSDIAYRNKQVLRRFIPSSETGITPEGAKYPPGAVDGEKIKLFFNQLVGAGRSERLIERLPLPVSLIATDIGNGDRVVMRDGSVTSAMRASMSVPGLLSPVDRDGRKLVDGGLVDNVPISEARERCNADVVIAVNVGSPLMKAEDVGSLISVSAQMVNLLTEQNVTRSLASLQSNDIYIRPDLGTITAGDFDRNAEAADRGRAAANTVREQLARLSVDSARYAQWREPIDRRSKPLARIDDVEVVGLKRVNPAMVERQMTVKEGEQIDIGRIESDVLRIYGDGLYQSVDYKLLNLREKTILQILPVEKPWGPDYLRFALNLEADNSQGSGFGIRVGYHKTLINSYGGELLTHADIGTRPGVGIDLYQPLDPARRFFAEGKAFYRRNQVSIYQKDERIAQYVDAVSGLELAAGTNLGSIGQAKLSWIEQRHNLNRDIGSPFFPEFDTHYAGWKAVVNLDQINQLYFASRGWAASAAYFDSDAAGYSRVDINLMGSIPWGKQVFTGRFSHASSPQGQLPLYDAATLGGYLNMSAFAKGQIIGDNVTYAGLRVERIIGTLGLGIRGDLRLGAALEAARVGKFYTETELVSKDLIDSMALYFASETPFGPAYFGLGFSTSGASNLFLSIGIP